MHTNDLRKLARETNDGVLRGPALGAADEIDRLRAENERLTKERDAQYDENVHRIAMQAKAEADRDIAKELLRSCINGNNALRKTAQERKSERDEARAQLADAERDMRQRAADAALLCGAEPAPLNDGCGTVILKAVYGPDIAKAILALPLKHADREARAALAQGQKEGE